MENGCREGRKPAVGLLDSMRHNLDCQNVTTDERDGDDGHSNFFSFVFFHQATL